MHRLACWVGVLGLAAMACSSNTDTTGSGGSTSTTSTGSGMGGAGGMTTSTGGSAGSGGQGQGGAGQGGSGGGVGGAGGGGLTHPTFVALNEGVWLIGWAGGLDHFSWLRFQFASDTGGTFDLIDAQGVTLTPYYQCTGNGSFSADAQNDTLTLQLPAACNATSQLRFDGFMDPQGFPPHAVESASITELMANQPLSGHQHLASFCDAGFTSCGDPFQP